MNAKWKPAVLAMVPGPPTGVHGKLHEICEPSDSPGASRFAARQGAEHIQIDWLSLYRSQIRINELEVGDFILSIIVNVLGHIPVELLKCRNVGCASSCNSRNFAVLDSPEFVVLDPQIAFDDFGRRQKPQNCHIAPGGDFDPGLTEEGRTTAKQPRGRSCRNQVFPDERAAVCQALQAIYHILHSASPFPSFFYPPIAVAEWIFQNRRVCRCVKMD